MLTMIDLLLFGTWTLLCVVSGVWIGHRRSLGLSPIPGVGERGNTETPPLETFKDIRSKVSL